MRVANRLVDVAVVSVDRDQGPGVKHQRVHSAAFLEATASRASRPSPLVPLR
jgi:hypothetical protein